MYSNFRYLYKKKGFTVSFHGTILITKIKLSMHPLSQEVAPIHSPGYNGRWFFSETSRACPESVNKMANDEIEQNWSLWNHLYKL